MATTMKKDRILTPVVIAAVTFLHVGLVSLLWHAPKASMSEISHIEFVDLGSLGGGDGSPEGGGKPAVPETPKPQSEPPKPKPKMVPPKPQLKPVEPEKPMIKPVVSKKAEADIQQPKEKTKPVEKPKPIEKPKPEPKPEPKQEVKTEPKAEKPVAKAEKPSERSGGEAKSTEADGKGSGESKGSGKGSKGEGSGRGEGSGSGSGGRKGDEGDGKGGEGGGNEKGSSRSSPMKGGTCQIPQPDYPATARESGAEGTVRLLVLTQPGGKIVSAKVIKTSGNASLDREARKAALRASCQSSVWTEYTVPVSFTSP